MDFIAVFETGDHRFVDMKRRFGDRRLVPRWRRQRDAASRDPGTLRSRIGRHASVGHSNLRFDADEPRINGGVAGADDGAANNRSALERVVAEQFGNDRHILERATG
jgi:hypothetical protein